MIEAWLVRYTRYGQPDRFITLDKNNADAFAIQHHGVVYPLTVAPLEQPCQIAPLSLPLSTTKEAECSRVV